MSLRHDTRKLLVQTLYEIDMKDSFESGIDVLRAILDSNIKNFSDLKDNTFAYDLFDLVVERRITIDEIITKAAPEWPVSKIGVVDRNVLRMGLSELLFGERLSIPPKVAIDEAIEVAKEFGGETSGKFVNGVLGAVYKEMGFPDSENYGNVEKKIPQVQNKAGSLVYSIDANGNKYIALVHDVFGYWTLSKGGVREGESTADCAKREALSEFGLEVSIEEEIGDHKFTAHHPEKGKIHKNIKYFLARSEYAPVKLNNVSGGITEVKWFGVEEVASLKKYKDLEGIFGRAMDLISQKK